MKKLITLSTIALTTLVLISTAQANEEKEAPKKVNAHTEYAKHQTHTKHWGYMGEVGPKFWSKVNPVFDMCSEGTQQSPINIVATKDVDLKPLALNYTAGSKSIINNGHTIQVNIAEGSALEINKIDYDLKQFHFHVPSENNINGNTFPLEAHFVHATKEGQLAVVAVMFVEGEENPVLTKIWKKLPTLKPGETQKCGLTVDEVKALMPKDKDYYKFTGSLTTPPCSEGVKWHIYKKPLTASKAQIAQFFSQFGFPNNRPVQATNNRKIEE